ncbi:hypothetical protein XENORESO_001616, partial [Xenotaenia resolanae]
MMFTVHSIIVQVQSFHSDISIPTHDSLIFTLYRSNANQLVFSFPIHLFHLSFLSLHEPISNYMHSKLTTNASTQDLFFLPESENLAMRIWLIKHLKRWTCDLKGMLLFADDMKAKYCWSRGKYR